MNQLERSLRLLDDSIVKSRRGLAPTKESEYFIPQQTLPEDSTVGMDFDMSLTVGPQELRSFLLDSQQPDGNLSYSRMSLAGSLVSTTGANVKHRVDALFAQFLEVLQRRTSESEIFETVEDLIETLNESLLGIERITMQTAIGRERKVLEDESWLNVERDTWKLLFALYKDRLLVSEQIVTDDLPLVNSEQTIVEHLYAANANLREYQLIVDWLEQTAFEQNRMQVGHFTDRTIAWENTLHQLQNIGFTAFGSSREIVKSLDPDAPSRERHPLHDLDMEDEARLSRQIFQEVRFGRVDVAQNLCEHCGQPWRAALLEGWRLHHDPNYEPAASTIGSVTASATNVKQTIEGNPRRDLWKKFAWKMAENRTVDEYTRATVGVFCGHLEALQAVLGEKGWADVLWAYLKVQIDIRTESEIRSHCIKSYLPMPDKYWNNKMSLEQIFEELEAHKNIRIKTASQDVDKVIQKYLILDDIPKMMRQIDAWLSETPIQLTAQMVRFLAHLVLFMRQIGRQFQDDIGDKIMKRYVECLIKYGDPQLVAFYSAALPAELQLLMYSSFLETVLETQARKRALEEANNFGLDVPVITVHTVEKIRNTEDETDDKPQDGDITALDQRKISALEWLTFYPDQRGELLWQTNALIRAFLAKRNVEAARKAFAMVPVDTIQQIINNYGSKDDLPRKEEASIKEYLCHQTYLAAIDGYNDWAEYFYSMKPKPPQLVKTTNFTERVASEHREQTYRTDLERWHSHLQKQTDLTRDLLYNILLFPEKGWLVDSDDCDKVADEHEEQEWSHRAVQMENLRKLCIPDVVLLLHSIFTHSGRYQESLLLADVIGSEQRQLYAVYSKHKLAEVMTKIAESSLALMNEKLDPFVGDDGKHK